MNTLRILFFLAAAACLQTASAYEVTVTESSAFDAAFGRGSGTLSFTHSLSPAFPMEFSFVGFVENVNPTPHPIIFNIEEHTGAPDSPVRHVFLLPPPDANGDPVSVPFSFTHSSPFQIRYLSEVSDGQIHVWGTQTQIGTVIDAPIIKLPNLVVPAGTKQVQGVVTISGGSQKNPWPRIQPASRRRWSPT